MTSPAQKANLARTRHNQRRSRARRKEYLQELEQRVRVYELQGIEASAEVQMSARKVLDENKKLRELLSRHEVTDACIIHHLQASAVNTPESSLGQIIQPGDAGVATKSLQQLMLPRQAAYLEQSIQFKVPSQPDDSISSVSTTHSSVWEPSQLTIAYNHHPQQLGVCPSDRHHCSPSVFPAQPATRPSNPFQTSSPGHMKSNPSHGFATSELTPIDSCPAANNQYAMDQYNDPRN